MANIQHLSILRAEGRRASAQAGIPRGKTERGMSVNSKGNLVNKGGKGFGQSARRRFKQCIEIFKWHMMSVDRTPTFWTFTIPDDTRVRIADGYQKLLKEFIKKVERKWDIKAYIYCTENQTEKRKQCHWHIMFDRFIKMYEMKPLWCEHLRDRGYVDKWDSKHNSDPLQSVRVETIENGARLEEYMMKYMSKVTSKDDEGARFWGCSKWIKMSPGIVLPMTMEAEIILKNAERDNKISCVRIYKSNTGIVYSCKKGEVPTPYSSLVGSSYNYGKLKCFNFFCIMQMKFFNAYMKCYEECDWAEACSIRDKVYEMVDEYWQRKIHKELSITYRREA